MERAFGRVEREKGRRAQLSSRRRVDVFVSRGVELEEKVKAKYATFKEVVTYNTFEALFKCIVYTVREFHTLKNK